MYRRQDDLDAIAATYARVVADRRQREARRAVWQRRTALLVAAMLLIGMGLAVRRWNQEWADAHRPVNLLVEP